MLLGLIMVISIKVEVGHQFSFHIINCFCQCFQELVEVFFVKEDLVPVITIFVEFLPAFRNSDVVIIATGSPHIEEIGSTFSSPDAFAVNAFHSFVGVFVRHSVLVFYSEQLSDLQQLVGTNIILFSNQQNFIHI